MKSLLKLVLGSVFLFLTTACHSDYENVNLKNLMMDRVASEKIKGKSYDEAMNIYIKMLETDSERPEIHSNIGNLFFLNKKEDEGFKSLHQALRLAELHHDAKNQFLVHYNLGVYNGSQKKIPEALQQYQAALDILPTSKETKTNIELLIQSGSSKDKSKEGDKNDQNKGDKDSKDKNDGQDGKGKDKNKDKNKDKDKSDSKEGDGKDKEDEKDPKNKKDIQQSAKYKPRPFQGDNLSEGDVKKILGELKNQEQRIRANFDKKERKESKNEKDW